MRRKKNNLLLAGVTRELLTPQIDSGKISITIYWIGQTDQESLTK